MPLIERPMTADERRRAIARREYNERFHGRGAGAPGLFADVDPSDPLPGWLDAVVDGDDE